MKIPITKPETVHKSKATMIIFAIFAIAAVLAACLAFDGIDLSGQSQSKLTSANGQSYQSSSSGIGTIEGSVVISAVTSADFSKADLAEATADSETVFIKLSGDSASADGDGVIIDGGSILINSTGTYSLSGTLNDGQIIVDVDSSEKVWIILNGVEITCSNSAAIYVKNSDKTIITLSEGTVNKLTDGAEYTFAEGEDEPSATVFSKDDLTINGKGSLIVTGNYKNGIQSKNDLAFTGGIITVNAANDGIKGKDSVCVKDAEITVVAGGDGIVSTNDSEESKGYIIVDSGSVTVTSTGDAIQAETDLTVNGGTISIVSGGGSPAGSAASGTAMRQGNQFVAMGMNGAQNMAGMPSNMPAGMSGSAAPYAIASTSTDDTESTKGLKANSTISIYGGSITIDSLDDAVHSNRNVVVYGGTLEISTGDDGIHADTYLEIDAGNINIAKSSEGIESKEIVISGGDINVAASDDGINAADGTGSDIGGVMSQGNCKITISGGDIYINANGDGLDVNGNIVMTGGSVIIDGPVNSGNGAMDYDGTFSISGGTLIAVGSVGMVMAPSSSSSQNSVIITFDSVQSAGNAVHIETTDGTEVLTYTPSKVYQSVVVSSPLLKSQESYVVYSGGTEFAEFTISGTLTYVGRSVSQIPMGGMPAGNMTMGDRNNPMAGGTMMNESTVMNGDLAMNGGNMMTGNGMMPGGMGNANMMPPDMQGMQGADSNMPQNMPPNMNGNMGNMNPGMNPNQNFNMNPYGNPPAF